MTIVATYGSFDEAKPEGMLRAVSFPQLLPLDTWTGDGRLVEAAGFGVRSLPRTIYGQYAKSFGHAGAVPLGRLDLVEIASDGNASGRGWLADLPHVSELWVPMIASKILFHNSVDLADAKARLEIEEDEDGDWELKIRFNAARLAGTTFVGTPAFPNAHGVLDEELVASFVALDDVEMRFGSWQYNFAEEELPDEIRADGGPVLPWADFHIPEADRPTKIVVDADGRVFGHLCMWDQKHMGIDGRDVYAPRCHSYASFNQAGPLTEKGQVETGPIFFLGGHPDHPLQPGQTHKAYGGVENAWADVRVTNGRFGPWISGRVRPGMDDNAIHVARCSRISPHYKPASGPNAKLQAIVSVNVPGFNVPGSELSADRDGAIIEGGEVLELVASFHEPERINVQPVSPPYSTSSTAGHVNITVNPGATLITAGDLANHVMSHFTNQDQVVECAAVSRHRTATASGSWDAGANEKRLAEPLTVSTARAMYAWVDTAQAKNGEIAKSACKFPHHKVSSDGKPGAASLTACSAGIAALNGGRGGADIADSERQGVYNHLAGHITDSGGEPPKLMSLTEIKTTPGEDSERRRRLALANEAALAFDDDQA